MSEQFDQIDKLIKDNRVCLFMKGSKLMPMCGFSARVVDVLDRLGVEYHTVDILQDEQLRASIKEYSSWPTLPQLYIDQEFIGGCDIVMQLSQSDQLQKLLFPVTS